MARIGDMAELVECARLEIAYTGNCIGGSNPSISARNKNYHSVIIFISAIMDVWLERLQRSCVGFGTERSEVKGALERREWELHPLHLRQILCYENFQ